MLQPDAITVQLRLEGMVVLDVAEGPERIDVAAAYTTISRITIVAAWRL